MRKLIRSIRSITSNLLNVVAASVLLLLIGLGLPLVGVPMLIAQRIKPVDKKLLILSVLTDAVQDFRRKQSQSVESIDTADTEPADA